MAHALQGTQFARRSPLLALIVLMHVAFIYFVNAGLRIELPLVTGPLELIRIAPEPTRPAEPIRAPATPQVEPSKLEVVVPDLEPVEALPDAPQPITVEGAVADTAAGQPGDTAPALDPRRPIGQPPYPSQSIRMDEEGLVRIGVCVQPDGRLTEVSLASSSGYPLLDQAALRHLRKPGMRLRPGTRGGQPVAMCTAIPVRFDLRNR